MKLFKVKISGKKVVMTFVGTVLRMMVFLSLSAEGDSQHI